MGSQITPMGFTVNAAKRAIHQCKDVEPALEWLFGHMDDADINTPLYVSKPSTSSTKPTSTFNEEHIGFITSMGFNVAQAKHALRANNQNPETALNWIFDNMDEISQISEQMDTNPEPDTPKEPTFTDGSAEYVLRSFVSHMGSNATAGHYVAHIRKDINKDEWIIVNDDKAFTSVKPPINYGYVYIFERKQ